MPQYSVLLCLLLKHIQYVTLRRNPQNWMLRTTLCVLTLPRAWGKGLHLLTELNEKNSIFTIYFSTGTKLCLLSLLLLGTFQNELTLWWQPQLQGKSNMHIPIFIMRNLKARVAKPLASPRTGSWQVRSWVSPNRFYSMPPALAVTLCSQGLNAWS